jgi:hypothetical protein
LLTARVSDWLLLPPSAGVLGAVCDPVSPGPSITPELEPAVFEAELPVLSAPQPAIPPRPRTIPATNIVRKPGTTLVIISPGIAVNVKRSGGEAFSRGCRAVRIVGCAGALYRLITKPLLDSDSGNPAVVGSRR